MATTCRFLHFSFLFSSSSSSYFFFSFSKSQIHICGYTLKACQTFWNWICEWKTYTYGTYRRDGSKKQHTKTERKKCQTERKLLCSDERIGDIIFASITCVYNGITCIFFRSSCILFSHSVCSFHSSRCMSLIVVIMGLFNVQMHGCDSHCCNYLSGKFTENVYLLKFQ